MTRTQKIRAAREKAMAIRETALAFARKPTPVISIRTGKPVSKTVQMPDAA